MNAHERMTAVDILGGIDAQKFRSCLTLFLAVDPDNATFRAALEKYFAGTPDPATADLLRGA
jgi:uncharacterized protein (DUF1810 family)